MRYSSIRLPLLVVSVCLGSGLSVWALDLRYDERVYLLPTTAEVVVPTSYVADLLCRDRVVLVAHGDGRTDLLPDCICRRRGRVADHDLRRNPVSPEFDRVSLYGRRRLVERSVISSYPSVYVPTSFAVANYYPTTYYAPREYVPTVL